MNTELLKLSPAAFCEKTNACADGAEFAAKYPTMREVWENCPRVDWLAWMLISAIVAPVDEKAFRLYMVWCARNTPLADGRTTAALITDPRSIAALEVVEKYARGEATEEELSAASSAASSAADAAWSAACSAQANEFRKIVPNYFA